jgi:hypothetical protein
MQRSVRSESIPSGVSAPITLHNYWPRKEAIKRSGTVN